MNTGQTLITIGAMLLLAVVILRVNTGFLHTRENLDVSKYYILATSLANSLLEEASDKGFDETTLASPSRLLRNLTIIDGLGPDIIPDSGRAEIHDRLEFDDFDDYDGYTMSVAPDSNLPATLFLLECKVDYVTIDNPNVASSIPTWHKRLKVNVFIPELSETDYTDSLSFSKIFSYWYFR